MITASMLYNLVQCPHRVGLDLYGPVAERDPVNPFIALLWERGHAFEQEVVQGIDTPFTNLRESPDEEKEGLTLEAMKRGDALIYGGRISVADLLGEPDLLARRGSGYVAGDIKSGAGAEGATEESDGKPKVHYAVQLGLYTDILERLGLSAGRQPFVWDINGDEVVYDLDASIGVRNPTTLWNEYQRTLTDAQAIESRNLLTTAALSSECKVCHWYSNCTRAIEQADDLTLIPEVGRTRRDAMLAEISSVAILAASDPETFIKGKKTPFAGIGPDSLRKFHRRAKLQKEKGSPILLEPLSLPVSDRELFFDIETDPMRDVCYLHGFTERLGGQKGTERYVMFFADRPTADAEKAALADALAFIRTGQPGIIYYYGHYERTWWRKLQKRFPDVLSEADVEALFDKARAVNLYDDVTKSKIIWPTRDHSIKTLATYLGFKWRDTHPSGAASIEWYHRWVESADTQVRQRIIDYNEDDCVATRVVLDAIRDL
jgi:predicted RecB family nuclease